jgi:hypothetical protein
MSFPYSRRVLVNLPIVKLADFARGDKEEKNEISRHLLLPAVGGRDTLQPVPLVRGSSADGRRREHPSSGIFLRPCPPFSIPPMMQVESKG